MNLISYLQETSRGSKKDLAEKLGVSASYLYQMATDRRPVPAELAPSIEAKTNLAVRRWDLRPDDWHRIWPELIGAEGAPALHDELVGKADEASEGQGA